MLQARYKDQTPFLHAHTAHIVCGKLLVVIAGLMFICQHAELASSLENHAFPPSVSRQSSTSGKGKTSLTVTFLRPL